MPLKLIREDELQVGPNPSPAAMLRAFHELTDFAQTFLQSGWSPEDVFWSRYFWFRMFVAVTHMLDGPDAGLDQQALQILEHPYPSCEPNWSQAESVDALAQSQATAWHKSRTP